MLKQIHVVEANDLDPKTFDVPLTFRVSLLSAVAVVRITVQFNRQSNGRCIEIEDITSHGVLSPELQLSN